MNELVIALDDEEERGWLKCSYCGRELAFTYADVAYALDKSSVTRASDIPAKNWIEAHRSGRPPFAKCAAAQRWETNRYKIIDWRHGDRTIREGWIQVTMQVSVD